MCLNNRLLERVKEFLYLGYYLSVTKNADIANKIIKFVNIVGNINLVMKSTIIQRSNRFKI